MNVKDETLKRVFREAERYFTALNSLAIVLGIIGLKPAYRLREAIDSLKDEFNNERCLEEQFKEEVEYRKVKGELE
jgi:K+ transporter